MVTPPPAGAAAAALAAQEQLDALRAQLAGTEAALATANDQLAARNLAALDLAAPAAGGPHHVRFFPTAGQGATDAALAAGPAAAAGSGAGAPADLPLAAAPADRDGDGADDDAAFFATYDDEGASSAGAEWAPAPYSAGGLHGGARAAGSHRGGADFTVDEFDSAKRPSAGDYLRSFSIPHDVRRSDGLPVPFKPVDNIHATDFAAGSRDEHEARQWYQLLAWLQQLHNDALRVRHTAGLTVAQYASFADYISLSSRRIFSIGAARYDYLAMRQTEPSLAEAYAHADAIPRNGRRGEGARRFLAGVVRQEAYASAKLGALERGFTYGGGRGGRGGRGGGAGQAVEPRHGAGGGGGGARPAPAGRAAGAERGGRGRGRGRA